MRQKVLVFRFGWVWREINTGPLSKFVSHVVQHDHCAVVARGGCVLVCVFSGSRGVVLCWLKSV